MLRKALQSNQQKLGVALAGQATVANEPQGIKSNHLIIKQNLKNYISSFINDFGSDPNNQGIRGDPNTIHKSHISFMAQLLGGTSTGEEDPEAKKIRLEFEKTLRREDRDLIAK